MNDGVKVSDNLFFECFSHDLIIVGKIKIIENMNIFDMVVGIENIID